MQWRPQVEKELLTHGNCTTSVPALLNGFALLPHHPKQTIGERLIERRVEDVAD